MKEEMHGGFRYFVEIVDKNGKVTDREEVHNLVPLEGLNHFLNVVLKAASPVAAWFIGVFEGNYTPNTNDVMSTFSAAATEATDYAGSTRKALTLGSVASGTVDNTATRAEFDFSAVKTIYGGFISSSSAKGGTSGVLLSVVRFSSPKSVDSESTLRITAGFTLASI